MREFIHLTNVYYSFAVYSAYIQVMETQNQAKPTHWLHGETPYHLILILKEGRINTGSHFFPEGRGSHEA